jgi:hypothetical protein
MSNWRYVEIAVVGPDAERLFTLNDRKELASDGEMVLYSGFPEDHPEYHEDYLSSMDGFVPARDTPGFGRHVRERYGVTPTVQFYGARKRGGAIRRTCPQRSCGVIGVQCPLCRPARYLKLASVGWASEALSK